MSMRTGLEQQDNRLSFMDQAGFLMLRATGRAQLMQCVWVYEHPIDFDAVTRFHQNLGYGLVGRRIEPSPLPFGRHRWVSSLGPPSKLDIAECARPRAELSDWADERAQLPTDPEWGPGWHLGVLPMTDGSTAISVVVSHYVVDGVGGLLTVVDAVKGNTPDFGHPPPRSRTRLRAVASDAWEAVRGAPEVARTLLRLARMAIRRRHDIARSKPSRPDTVVADGDVVVPAISVFIDLENWDARAKALGGTSYSLMAGFAAKLGERLGRQRDDDGAVTLLIAISDRTADDTRANAMSFANVSVDATRVTTDLSGARVAIRHGLATMRKVPDEALQLFPLIPWIPKRAVKRMADIFFGSADLPVSCSNFGDVDPAVRRLDGTDAEYVILRGVDQGVSRMDLERAGGQLVLVSGRFGDKISIAVLAYQPGGDNSKPYLRKLAADTLAEFELTAVID
jgi:hypothetical protein